MSFQNPNGFNSKGPLLGDFCINKGLVSVDHSKRVTPTVNDIVLGQRKRVSTSVEECSLNHRTVSLGRFEVLCTVPSVTKREIDLHGYYRLTTDEKFHCSIL